MMPLGLLQLTLPLHIVYTFLMYFECNKMEIYRGADKSLARPGRKQATATKLSLFQATQKKKLRNLSRQPGLRGSNDLHVGRKMATFQLFVQ